MAITITPDELKKSAHQFRKMLLTLPSIALAESLPYFTVRSGVQYKQTTGQISNAAQFGPYNPKRKGSTTKIDGRTLETFLGSVIEEFDPNEVVQSIYGSLINQGEALKQTDIAKAILSAMMISMSEGLNDELFKAVRNDAGTKSVDLFNGFDTIAATEIAAGKISKEERNLFDFGSVIDSNNAKDALKEFYRSASPELKKADTIMYVPFDVLEAYEDDYQQTVGATVYNKSFEKTILEGSRGKCELVPLSNKSDSNIIQLTTKSNMIIGSGAGLNNLEELEVDRFSAFEVTLSAAIIFGVQYDSIHNRRIHFGKLAAAPAGGGEGGE